MSLKCKALHLRQVKITYAPPLPRAFPRLINGSAERPICRPLSLCSAATIFIIQHNRTTSAFHLPHERHGGSDPFTRKTLQMEKSIILK